MTLTLQQLERQQNPEPFVNQHLRFGTLLAAVPLMFVERLPRLSIPVVDAEAYSINLQAIEVPLAGATVTLQADLYPVDEKQQLEESIPIVNEN
jgi:hypothetical protein